MDIDGAFNESEEVMIVKLLETQDVKNLFYKSRVLLDYEFDGEENVDAIKKDIDDISYGWCNLFDFDEDIEKYLSQKGLAGLHLDYRVLYLVKFIKANYKDKTDTPFEKFLFTLKYHLDKVPQQYNNDVVNQYSKCNSLEDALNDSDTIHKIKSLETVVDYETNELARRINEVVEYFRKVHK